MENIGILKQFSMDHYIGDLHDSIYDIVQAKDDEKVMKEIGYIVSESLRALYAYKRNGDNKFIFTAVMMTIEQIAKELQENDLNLAKMFGE